MTALEMARRIELWPLDRLVPYARNARTHTPAQVAKIAASIREFGFTNPILVDGGSGIIAGHARLAAAHQLGMAEVPVIELTHLTQEQKRAYVLADNRLALEAGWDIDLLAGEIAELKAADYDIALTGFDEQELVSFLARSPGQTSEEDEPPSPTENPVSRPGDVWCLGAHRLLCGDALDPAQVDALMEGRRARMAFTDPPWNVAIGQDSNPLHRQRPGLENDDVPPDDFNAFLERAAASIARAVTGDVFVVMSSSHWPNIDTALRGAGLHWSGTIVWVKDTFVLGRSNFHRRYEPIWYGWQGGAKSSFRGRRDLDDVWEFPRPRASEEHLTMKPVALVRKAIEASSRQKDVVLDLFAGSGSTLVACEESGRTARLMEIDPRYCDIIVRRWQILTGETATLLNEVPGGQAPRRLAVVPG